MRSKIRKIPFLGRFLSWLWHLLPLRTVAAAAYGSSSPPISPMRAGDGALNDEIGSIRSRLTQLERETAALRMQGPSHGAVSQDLDAFYVAFEDAFRGDPSAIAERMRPHTEKLRATAASALGRPVLDIGCGRGEWLQLLKDNGYEAYGIDINGVMVEITCARGLQATTEDLLTHLRSCGSESLGAITAFHVVEHLPFEVLIAFFDEALRALVPGGVLFLETPNPENLRVGATTFYYDPTHRNPIPPPVLQFMASQRGFEIADLFGLHPYPDADHFKGEDAAILNKLLSGPQDYALIARKKQNPGH